MKALPFIGMTMLALIVGATGCASRSRQKKTESVATINLAPGNGPRGYVEFITLQTHRDSGVWVYQPQDLRPRLLGVVGVRPGGELVHKPKTAVPVCETLRVAVEPGLRVFLIEKEGELLRLFVEENQVTQVEIDRAFIDRSVNYEVYCMKTRVLAPVVRDHDVQSARVGSSAD